MIFGIDLSWRNCSISIYSTSRKINKKKSEHHIITGDHEDVKKDLDSH